MNKAAAQRKDALAKQDAEAPISVMSSMPDYLQEAPTEPIRGAENVRREDVIMPRLNVCGKQSPQFDETNEKHIPGLKMGDYFNTITREIYGQRIYTVPLFELNTRAKYRDYKESGPPFCISHDGKIGIGDPGGECRTCKCAQFTAGKNGKNERPECTDQLNFAVLLLPEAAVPKSLIWDVTPRLETISILGFKSTSFKKGQEWITMLKLRNRDWFTTVFKLTSEAKSDGKNSWHIPVPENAGWLAERGAKLSRPMYESAYEIYREGRMKVDAQEQE